METGIPMHKPYIPAQTRLPEMTLRALITGTLLGIIFGASSLYLVLKVGLTVSASIPVAVISHHAVPAAVEDARARCQHPRAQHRADGRLGG